MQPLSSNFEVRPLAVGKTVVIKPMYIYSIGEKLCGTHVRITDHTREEAPSRVVCFHTVSGHRFRSLAFHVYADFLFFSDINGRQIQRMRMETSGDHVQTIAANTGTITGQVRPN